MYSFHEFGSNTSIPFRPLHNQFVQVCSKTKIVSANKAEDLPFFLPNEG